MTRVSRTDIGLARTETRGKMLNWNTESPNTDLKERALAWCNGDIVPKVYLPRGLSRRQALELMTNACCGD